MYCAMIGDLIASKQIQPEERKAVQVRLGQLLEEMNGEFNDYLASPFLITLGDEFQGLLTAAEPALEIMEYIDRGLEEYRVRVRYAMGIGEISTGINRTQALGDDGPAYHLARQGMEFLKKEQWTGFPVSIQTGQPDSVLLQGICQLMNELAETWSPAQRQYVLDMELLKEQMLVAMKNNVQQSSVSRTLKRSHYKTYRQTKKTLEDYLLSVYDCPEKAGRLGRYNRAVTWMRNQAYQEAIVELDALLAGPAEHDGGLPDRTDILACLGTCYVRQYDYEQATAMYQSAIQAAEKERKAGGELPRLYNSLGYCYIGLSEQIRNGELHAEQAGDSRLYAARAAQVLEVALPLCEDKSLLEMEIRSNLANAYGKQGDLEKEITCRQELLCRIQEAQLQNSDVEIANLHNLGGAYERLQRLPEALNAVRRAVGLVEARTVPVYGAGRIYFLYGRLLKRTGAEQEEVLRQFQKALSCSRQEDDADCITHACLELEQIYRETENQEAADQCAEIRLRTERKRKKRR